jgi:hypothetical protein
MNEPQITLRFIWATQAVLAEVELRKVLNISPAGPMRKTMREIGNGIAVISIALCAIGYVWSLILAWRKSSGWFRGLLFLWVIFYPIFVVKNWNATKNNFLVFVTGIGLFAIAFWILAATNPYRAA